MSPDHLPEDRAPEEHRTRITESVSSEHGPGSERRWWRPPPTPLTGDASFTWWTGWDERRGASADASAAGQFTRSAPKDPSAGAHFELLAVAARGFRPPKFLSAGPGNEIAAASEAAERPGLRQAWSLLYRPVAQTAPAQVAPFAIYLLGVDPPADANEDDLVVFNDFYTDVHLPEVAERRRALRAVRYELVDAVRPPYQGAPRFLAVYEVDEESAANRRHSGPKYARGPDVWQRHTTPWRLWYRRLDPAEPESI